MNRVGVRAGWSAGLRHPGDGRPYTATGRERNWNVRNRNNPFRPPASSSQRTRVRETSLITQKRPGRSRRRDQKARLQSPKHKKTTNAADVRTRGDPRKMHSVKALLA